MSKLYIKRMFLVITTLVVIVISFYLYLPPQVNIVDSMNVTVGDEKVDVIFVGSSHVFAGINPLQMYRERGIAGYDISIGSQAPWQSYYYIKEVCQKQSPKIIVFDTYMVGVLKENDYQDYQTVNNLLNCPFSINKIEAVLASKADSKLSIIMRFPYIYNKYKEFSTFSCDKFYGQRSDSLGYEYNNGIQEYNNVVDVKNVSDILPIDVKSEKYLRLIIEYCQDNNIEIVLTNAPWPCITIESQMRFNKIAEIAAEYDIPFLDGCKNCEEIGMDYLVDSYGDNGHLNYSGASKYTTWIGKFLSENYSLPDRRGESGYELYEQLSAECKY